MSAKIKILGIAPYKELKNTMNIVSKQFEEIDSNIYTADLEEGQRLATELFHNDYDAVISRGGTADLIRQAVSIPIIDVSISIYDVLGAIRLASSYSENIAIIGYASITEKAHLLCDILDYNIRIITLHDSEDADKILDALADDRHEMILCDVVTNRLALTKSLNTILITSGIESIKHAFQEALTISKYLKRAKHKKQLLEQSLIHQKEQFLIVDEWFEVQFSNLKNEVETFIIKFLSSKNELAEKNQYYQSIQNNFYNIYTKRIVVDGSTYYSCIIKNSTPPIIKNQFGVLYQKRAEVEEIFTTKFLSTKFIQENTKQELKNIKNFYNSLIIFGESGTAKSAIAYQAYLNQEIHNNNLITINSKLMDGKMWKFLVNPSNGPFVDEDSTILFENVEQLSMYDMEQLITIIRDTKLLQRNTLFFTYNTNNISNDATYNRLLTELQGASIYAPSIKERKNELSVMITLLLNRMNIECNKDVMGFEPNAMKEMIAYDWPGNFNQLQLAIKELILNSKTHYISEHQVVQLLKKEQLIQNLSNSNTASFTLQNAIEQPTLFDYTKEIILNVLEQNNGNQTTTAKQLNISRTTLWRYLKKE